jgi:hypothetical protein
VCGGVLGAIARIALPQPNVALARISPGFLVPQQTTNNKTLLTLS